MPIKQVEFSELQKRVSKEHKPALDCLASEIGKVYVVSITRDGCPACKKQKPRLEKLAKSILAKHGDKVVFTTIHVKYSPEHGEESLLSKDVFGHYFYPTALILLRTRDRGAIEYYRNASPQMDELRKNIEAALETATMIKKTAD